MKNWILIIVVCLTLSSVAVRADEPTAAGGTANPAVVLPGASVTEVVTMKATVTKINLAKRKVTLQGENGKIVKIKVDKKVQNLDQLKVGDTIEVDYLDTVAVSVLAPGAPTENVATAVAVAPGANSQDSVMAETVQMTAQVTDIDYQKYTVKLKWPDGKTKRVKVDKNLVKNFAQIKVGDRVLVTTTEAVGIAIRQPKASAS